MESASWLWEEVRDLFEVDDGSLPEVRVNYSEGRATALGYELIQNRAASIVTDRPHFWSKVHAAEVPLSAVPNAAALVVSGESEAFHVVFTGIEFNGTVIPDVGVFVFPDELTLDYRMGSEWNDARVRALFELLAALLALDSKASLSLEDAVLPEIKSRFSEAWQRWCAEHAA
jgi:hypothetical protein